MTGPLQVAARAARVATATLNGDTSRSALFAFHRSQQFETLETPLEDRAVRKVAPQ